MWQAECEAYIGEMEVTGGAYEELQAQNVRLLSALAERDEANARLLAERGAAQQAAAAAAEERAAGCAARDADLQQRALLAQRVSQLESRLQARPRSGCMQNKCKNSAYRFLRA